MVEIAGEPELKCRCPFCKRKYRYHASRCGQGVICRQCKTAFVFPAAEEAEPQA
jgi:transposase-like protein